MMIIIIIIISWWWWSSLLSYHDHHYYHIMVMVIIILIWGWCYWYWLLVLLIYIYIDTLVLPADILFSQLHLPSLSSTLQKTKQEIFWKQLEIWNLEYVLCLPAPKVNIYFTKKGIVLMNYKCMIGYDRIQKNTPCLALFAATKSFAN